MEKIIKGKLGEMIVQKALLKSGYNLFLPLAENGKIDLIAEKDNIFFRIQIKVLSETSTGSKFLPVRKLSHSKTTHKVFLYSKKDIDLFCGVDLDTEDIFLVPVEVTEKYTAQVSLTVLEKYKNNFILNMEPLDSDVQMEQQNIGESSLVKTNGNAEA